MYSFLCLVWCFYVSVDVFCDVYFEEKYVVVIYVYDFFSIGGCNGKK